MKKVFIGIALLAIVTINLINVTPELINSSNFSLSMAQAWEPENPELWPGGDGDVGQIPVSRWETTRVPIWYFLDEVPILIGWETIKTEFIDCIDNYVCPECTCQPAP